METIPLKTMRNDISKILRRVEAGETFTITVSGRPVAELHGTKPRRWADEATIAAIWHSPAPQTLTTDLEKLSGNLTDPFAP